MEETIASLPHIDQKISTRLLRHFGSIKKIMTANLQDFFEVRGIGEKIATDIIEYIYSDYNEIETGEESRTMKEDLEFLREAKNEKATKKSENGEN